MSNIIRINLFMLLAGLFLLVPCSETAQSSPQNIRIGLVPERNIFDQYDRYLTLLEYITAKTGIGFEISVFTSYGDIISRFEKDNLDGAFFGSFTGVLAHERLDVVSIARPVGLNGESTYHGHIFVRKDSGIKSVKDMKGKVMAFVSRANLCGHIFALAYFRENGIPDIDSFLKEYYFTGGHDAVVRDVFDKRADVGVVKKTVYDLLIESNPRMMSELVILAESSEFPKHGLFFKEDLDGDVKRRIKETLINMDKYPNGRKVLKEFGALKFIRADMHNDYKSVFEAIKKAGIDLDTFDLSK